ncbi:MAG TPA: hypothetical protein VM099_17000 [Gemmatimonadaceae bacterium]|nr:hypothetical protein [Gemmatimonadaceae bacterium]
MNEEQRSLRALCVGRHEYVSEHIGRFFGSLGIETECVVGADGVLQATHFEAPDVILCEYELLTSFPITSWETHERLAKTAVIGVSLSRRPNETVPLDVNGIAGFLYLPTLDRENALRVIHAAAASTRAQYNVSPPRSSITAVAERNSSTR